MPKQKDTSWGKSAEWYEDVVADDDSFQKNVILPNLLRLMKIESGEQVLDMGCGTGFFSREFAAAGGKVVGVDLGEELLKIAKQNVPAAEFKLASADSIPFVKNETVDKAVFVLSLQNMSDQAKALTEAARTLKQGGKLFLVLNHPAFRIPGASSWGWEEKTKTQYRRVDAYLSERKAKIEMHPGKQDGKVTWSFHAPLQYYFKIFNKSGLLVEKLEEWISHRETPTGPRKTAENRARAEFPMFMTLVLIKN